MAALEDKIFSFEIGPFYSGDIRWSSGGYPPQN